jgi:nucleotide-binding universal stress UspA family protein
MFKTIIVVGSAHHGRVGRVLAGDVTAGTLHGAPCPVLVAPRGHVERAGGLQAIGVGFDGSPESQAAVELAHGIARAVGEAVEAGRSFHGRDPRPLPDAGSRCDSDRVEK